MADILQIWIKLDITLRRLSGWYTASGHDGEYLAARPLARRDRPRLFNVGDLVEASEDFRKTRFASPSGPADRVFGVEGWRRSRWK